MTWVHDHLFQIVTAAVAVYAALLSTITVLQRWREKKVQIKVRLTHGFVTGNHGLGPPQVIVSVHNEGDRPVYLTNVTIRLPDGAKLFMPGGHNSSIPMPCELTHGRNVTCWFTTDDVAEALRERRFTGTVQIQGVAHDGMNREHRSKPHDFKLNP
jgi:hypothetical protein